MVGGPGSIRLIVRLAWAAFVALACQPVCAQTTLSLGSLGERGGPPDYVPAHLGERVVVRGVVSAPPFHFPNYTLLAIQTGQRGGVLEAPKGDATLDALRPGNEVEAEGLVAGVAGMPVVAAGRIAVLGQAQPPAPVPGRFGMFRASRGTSAIWGGSCGSKAA